MDAVKGPSALSSIKFLTGPLAGRSYQITKPVTSIGREQNNDIVIPDPSVSRHHLQINWNNGSWTIIKLVPQNSVTLNQRDIQQATITDNDTIGLGVTTTFLFQISAVVQQPPRAVNPELATLAGAPAPIPPAQQASRQSQIPTPPSVQKSPSTYPFKPEAASSIGGSMDMGTLRAPESFANANSPGTPTLYIRSNTDKDKQTHTLTKPVISIGRDPSCDIVIDRPTVSGFHAQIRREGNQLVFIHPHPNARNGRTLNGIDCAGRVIRGDEQFRKELARGDLFRISDEHGSFVTLTYNDGTGAPQEQLPEIRPIPLGTKEITLGRLADNNVVLSHPQVSGHHARLEQVRGGYRIVDLRSKNSTFVNGDRITQRLLIPGDEIRIGPFKLAFTGTQLTEYKEQGIRIDARNILKKGNNNTVLLNDISIVIPPRKFVAVVGGSGAGKSTLMDALNGLRPAQQGLVLYNGQDYYRNLAAFSTQLGYVPQDDIIHRDITVENALYYAAKLRLPDDFTEQQIRERVNDVLEDVEMKFRRNLLVSKLSGGQRKRVSIALELLANPSVFFLDEPTSGLDPGLDRKMMLLLRRLADRGRTIILVTHATNNIYTCDYVCFLAAGGYLAYFGPPNEAKTYFGKDDFAEIYSALEPTEEHKDIPKDAATKFLKSSDYQRYVKDPLEEGPRDPTKSQITATQIKQPKRGNPIKQFFILCARYLELVKNDTGNLLILLLQAPVIGSILLLLAGAGTFNATSVATCPLHQDPINQKGPIVSLDCAKAKQQLDTPQGQAFAEQQGKKPEQILQDAIVPGSGGDAQKILFIMSFAAVFFGCLNGSREIVKELAVYRRERAVNLGIMPYMFSKIIVLGLLCLLQSLVVVALVNFKARFQQGIFLPPFLEVYITMALTSLAGLMLGLLVSSVVANSDRATSLIPVVLLPQVIFAG